MRKIVIISLLCLMSLTEESTQDDQVLVDEPTKSFVLVVTLENFDELIKNSPQDVLLDFYAPWCGHCKKLEPLYEQLAEQLSVNPNIIIAKVDATVHKIPGVTIKGYPTLKFFKKGSTPEILDYSGPRTLEGFVNFIQTNSANGQVQEEQVEPIKEEL